MREWDRNLNARRDALIGFGTLSLGTVPAEMAVRLTPDPDPPRSGTEIEFRRREAERAMVAELNWRRRCDAASARMRAIGEMGVDMANGLDRTVLNGRLVGFEADQIIFDEVNGIPHEMVEKLTKPAPDPRLAAEKLLRSVLPDDLYIALAATGQCIAKGKTHEYTLAKGKKTICKKAPGLGVGSGKAFSCCIGLEDQQAPDTDRIVAEYLLIINDEKQYLETANLTEVYVSPHYRPPQWSDQDIQARPAAYRPYIQYNPADPPPTRVRDAVLGRAPEPWAPEGRRPIHGTDRVRYDRAVGRHLLICQELFRLGQELFRLVFEAEWLNHPFPNIENDRWRGMGERMLIHADFTDDIRVNEDFTLEEIRERYLRPMAASLQRQLDPMHVNILGFLPVVLPRDAEAASEVHFDNKHLAMIRRFDVRHGRFETSAYISFVVPR